MGYFDVFKNIAIFSIPVLNGCRPSEEEAWLVWKVPGYCGLWPAGKSLPQATSASIPFIRCQPPAD